MGGLATRLGNHFPQESPRGKCSLEGKQAAQRGAVGAFVRDPGLHGGTEVDSCGFKAAIAGGDDSLEQFGKAGHLG